MKTTILLFTTLMLVGSYQAQELKWQPFHQRAFDQAEAENKFILLNLKANWCHWCHVMDDSVYSNAEIVDYLNEHYVLCEADQDANPDLANRYRNYGWPATVVFNTEGMEIVKRRGYMNPRAFQRLMKAIVADPTPEESQKTPKGGKPDNSVIAKRTNELATQLEDFLDLESGGYAQAQKYIDYDAWEYALAHRDDARMVQWMERSVEGAYQLSDPVWGGIFQYSTHGDWQHIHYEKLLSIQARYIQIFLDYYALTGNQKSIDMAEDIVKYCDRFLLLQNGLYASAQDADLEAGKHSEDYYALNNEERLALGIPRVDANGYTNTNAAMAQSLYRLWLVTENEHYKKRSALIVQTLIDQRKTDSGLFEHSDHLNTVALDDNLAMAKTFIALYNMSGDKQYRAFGTALLQDMHHFILDNGALADPSDIEAIEPQPIMSDNIEAARIFNLAAFLWDEDGFEKTASSIINYLFSDAVYADAYIEGAMVCASEEMGKEPKHIVVVVVQDVDEALINATRSLPGFYHHIEVTPTDQLSKDQKELFGDIKETTVFSCTAISCSAPIYDVEGLRRLF